MEDKSFSFVRKKSPNALQKSNSAFSYIGDCKLREF